MYETAMRFVTSTFLSVLLVAPLHSAEVPPAVARRVEFERDVRPILAKTCFSCHGPEKQKGGLRLDRKSSAMQGGDDGPAILSGKGAESLLVRLAAGVDADRVMPPKGDRLTAEQIGILRAWIDQGTIWTGTDDREDPRNWWSLRPLGKPPLPSDMGPSPANPIDAFVRSKLREKGLSPSPEADRRTLIRRLSFDLIGLPPTPEEIDAFIVDTAPGAYESLVDRLLASSAYGERWARHWLDVVHYGDTHGYDKDKPRPNAWPYRDYVIRSLNADKPYGRFVQEQLAGDALFPGTEDGITALGFIAAGPWDFIGHAEVSEAKIDGKIARHLDRDDMVTTAMQTFNSLTVQCAQCHHHKFDPIRQEDYYRLHAIFAAVDRADKPYFTDTNTAKRWADLTTKQMNLKEERRAIDAAVAKAGGAELSALDRRIALASAPAASQPQFGYHSAVASKQDMLKWVQVDLGKSASFDEVILWGCHDTYKDIGAGFGFPVRYKVEVANDPEFKTAKLIVDRSTEDVPNPGVSPVSLAARGLNGRYVRVTATKLASRKGDFNFALAELEVLADGKNLAAGAAVSALDSIEAPVRWRKANLTDGYAPGRESAIDLAALKRARQELIVKVTDAATAKMLAATEAELHEIDRQLLKLKPTGVVYAGTVHTGSGSFRGTGPEGKPRTIRVLKRGNIHTPGAEVSPGAPGWFDALPGDFRLPAEHSEGDRRAALAKWLTDPRNPLTWRSIVNRVWQYHFGRGLVATPNDFGRMGQLPTHPELLDWLAADFRDGGQSLKRLHKLIVTSATYRQSSASVSANETKDIDNAYLWRMPRRKLEAEAIRDAALAVAGKLDRKMYGPAFQDFVIEHPAHSPHYQYHLANPADASAFRRSVYRFLVRSKPQPFMTVLDCADPSMQVEKRNETLSPLQALALFNNGVMLVMAKGLSERVAKEPDPVTTAFRLAVGRPPTATEKRSLAEYAEMHGLPSACRVILNLNEFVFVD